MAMKTGETYRCADSKCGCEIHVTQGSRTENQGMPRCCCGHEMQRAEGAAGQALGNEAIPS